MNGETESERIGLSIFSRHRQTLSCTSAMGAEVTKHVWELKDLYRMNHYEKLTTIILRVVGCGLTLFTLVGIGWGFLINS